MRQKILLEFVGTMNISLFSSKTSGSFYIISFWLSIKCL